MARWMASEHPNIRASEHQNVRRGIHWGTQGNEPSPHVDIVHLLAFRIVFLHPFRPEGIIGLPLPRAFPAVVRGRGRGFAARSKPTIPPEGTPCAEINELDPICVSKTGSITVESRRDWDQVTCYAIEGRTPSWNRCSNLVVKTLRPS